jgi:hypothetical protein
MSVRRLGFWLGFLIAFSPYIYSLFFPEQPEGAITSDLIRFFAGQTVYRLNMFLPVVAGILIADRLVRDRRLGVEDLIKSTALDRVTYILGKYFGSLLSILTPAFVLVAVLAGYVSVYLKSFTPIPWFLMAFLTIIVPAYAFITAFSLACPMVMPLRDYQVMFTGYWIRGNFLSPKAFPTLAGTLLTPGSIFAMEGFFGTTVMLGQTSLHTPTEAVLNLIILGLCIAAALVVLERYLALRAKAA